MKEREEKKIGKRAAILTWCDNNGPTNYGQILQCYAMQKLVEGWGYASFVVQYRPKDERDFMKHNFSNRNCVGRKLNAYFEQKYNLRVVEKGNTIRVQRFKEFIQQNIRLTPPCYTKEMVEYETKDCELLVCGSDQIWNPLWVNSVWLLGFGTKKQKRIAYAPSGIFADDEEMSQCYKKMVPLIERLDKVMLREQCGVDILKKYTDKEMEAVLDPTLSLSQEQWNEVAAKRVVEDAYIFCYFMGSIRPYQLLLRKLMQEHQVRKIVYIPSNLMEEGVFSHFQPYPDAGPAEFISLIRHAKAVCTDSFHGTVFAILYNKLFYNMKRAQEGSEKYGGSERIRNLLEQLGLQSRNVENIKDIIELGKIDKGKI